MFMAAIYYTQCFKQIKALLLLISITIFIIITSLFHMPTTRCSNSCPQPSSEILWHILLASPSWHSLDISTRTSNMNPEINISKTTFTIPSTWQHLPSLSLPAHKWAPLSNPVAQTKTHGIIFDSSHTLHLIQILSLDFLNPTIYFFPMSCPSFHLPSSFQNKNLYGEIINDYTARPNIVTDARSWQFFS